MSHLWQLRVAFWVCFHQSPTLCKSPRPPQEWDLRLSGTQLPMTWTLSHYLEASSESVPPPVYEAVIRDSWILQVLSPAEIRLLPTHTSWKEKPQADPPPLVYRASPLPIPQADLPSLRTEPHPCSSPSISRRLFYNLQAPLWNILPSFLVGGQITVLWPLLASFVRGWLTCSIPSHPFYLFPLFMTAASTGWQ